MYILLFRKKSAISNKDNENFKPIVFVNNPVKRQKDDIVGFDSQVETLACAIESGANMIGVIADYGSGKSSLTDILSESLKKRKKITKPIKINLWDCLQKNANPKPSDDEKISVLTRSFLYQLSSGHGRKFGSFINKILSKNYGNISFGINSWKFWWMFIIAGLMFVIYKISTLANTGIMQYLPEGFGVIASGVKLLSPFFLFLACVFLILGIKDTYIAFSHWKMQEKRELEINDVFDTYSTIVNKIRPLCKRKKLLVIVEDLDRITEKPLVVEFLKELYRFHDTLGEYSENFVFVVSIKPEALLKPNSATEDNVYTKVFDTVISLKPIHFDDYDSVLLKLIDNNPKQKAELQRLIKSEIKDTLPQSFKWIKKGENLTLRDLKDRLNHAIAIMLSIKSKNYQVSTAANFEACTAIAYFESHYPKEYYKLIKNEAGFASFMRTTPEIINGNTKDVQPALVASFNTTFKNGDSNNAAYSKTFVDELCGLVASGVFNDDFRMYFYTYPKGSPIKTSDERELCNYLLFPNIYKNHGNLDEVVIKVFKDGKNSIVEKTLKSLEKYPPVILKNTTLFVTAVEVSLEKAFDIFSEEIIESDYDEKYKAECWFRLNSLETLDYEGFVHKAINKILVVCKSSSEIIKIRKSIILGLRSKIADFIGLFENSKDMIPLITADEIKTINDIDIILKFIDVNVLKKDNYEYIAATINNQPLNQNSETFKIACNVFRRFSKLLSPIEMGDGLLKFVDINNYLDDGFFEIISKAEIKHRDIATYLNKFSASELSAEYIKIIDSLGFDDYISEDIIDTVLQEKHYYTPLLFLAKENDFSKFDSHLANNLKLLETCEKINEDYQDVIIGFRKYAFQNKARSEYKILYFEPFPIISTEEYVSMTEASELFKLVDTSQINEENYSEVSDMLCERTYATSELVDLFDWLFNNEKNENCISDPVLRKNFFESFDLRKLELRKLDDQQRSYTYSVIADVIVVNTPDDAISVMKRFDCLIPEIEPIVQKDSKKYSALIASMNEFSSETLKWLDKNFIRDGLSETLCKVLYEREDYINFIIADVLRKKDMILDENIPFEDYISVYENVPEMFSIMSEHYDFLEKLQLEADLDKLPQEKIVPMFKVPQHKRFFEFIFSSNQPDELKNEYLSSFGKFASLDDSLAFQKLVCKEENMKLLGSHRIFNRIYRNLWELNRGHKGVFTRKWNECWKDKLDETHLL